MKAFGLSLPKAFYICAIEGNFDEPVVFIEGSLKKEDLLVLLSRSQGFLHSMSLAFSYQPGGVVASVIRHVPEAHGRTIAVLPTFTGKTSSPESLSRGNYEQYKDKMLDKLDDAWWDTRDWLAEKQPVRRTTEVIKQKFRSLFQHFFHQSSEQQELFPQRWSEKMSDTLWEIRFRLEDFCYDMKLLFRSQNIKSNAGQQTWKSGQKEPSAKANFQTGWRSDWNSGWGIDPFADMWQHLDKMHYRARDQCNASQAHHQRSTGQQLPPKPSVPTMPMLLGNLGLVLKPKELADADYFNKIVKPKYRQLVKTCHPDLHPGDAIAEATFKKITEAYEALERQLLPKTA